MKRLFSILSIVILALTLGSCSGSKNAAKTKTSKDGWVTIFDGTSFKGWRGYTKESVPPKWTLQGDGTMKLNTPNNAREGQEGGGDIIWDEKLKNFEFEIEWMAPAEGNSGIFYLAQELPGKPIYTSAPEYQLGTVRVPGQVNKQAPASLYDIIGADPQNVKPAGEWNKAKIIVNNGNVQHWQNDVKVVEYKLWDQGWRDLLNSSKFSERRWPEAFKYQVEAGGPNREGYIGLQDHGLDMYFRNARLKKLP